MKLLTKNSDYAIRAVLNLARNNGKYISSKNIANEEKIPLYYLRRILQRLIKKGILKAKEGVGGGVRLNVSPKEIQVIDLIKIFQGDVQLMDCMFRDKICANRANCILKRRIENIENLVIREFENINIKQLMKEEK